MLNAVQIFIVVHFILVAQSLWGQSALLRSYVDAVLEEHPEIQHQRLIEDERLLAIAVAGSAWRPTVDVRSDYLLSAGGRRIDIPVGSLVNPINATLNEITGAERLPTGLANVEERFLPSNFHDTRLEVTLPLIAPRIASQRQLRQAEAAVAVAHTDVVVNRLRYRVKESYYGLLEAESGLRIIDSALLVLTETLRLNRSLVRHDKQTRDAVLASEAELAALEGDRAAMESQRAVAAAALNRLLGRAPDAPLATAAEEPIPDPDAENDWPLRPELRELEAADRVLNEAGDLIRAEGQPTLGLSLQAGAQGFLDGGLSDHPYALLGVGMQWNLFDGSRSLRQQINALQRRQLAERRQDAERGIAIEQFRAREQIEAARRQLTARATAITAGREAARITEARYRAGQALPLELLDARNRLTRAELQHNLARYRLLRAYAALEAANGAPNQ